MKLNPDCIRDILLTIESIPGMNYYYRFNEESIKNDFNNYSKEEIFYHIRQCDMAGFLYKVSFTLDGECTVADLTPAGHQFLADIRSDNVWNKTKSVAKEIGAYSLDTLSKIASAVITEFVRLQFLNP